jgi:aspartate/methionine/tyrosine aminotransferase
MTKVIDFPLARRAVKYVTQLSGYEKAIRRVISNTYHPQNNSSGIINIGVAENILMSEIMSEKIRELNIKYPLLPDELHYTDFSGSLELKTTIANLLKKFIFRVQDHIDHSQLIIFNGAGAIIEQTVSVLCDPDEAVMIPAPMYLAFERDVVKRFGCKLIPVIMPYNKKSNTFNLDITIVHETLLKARNDGISVKCFLLCTPGNPLGNIHTKQEMKELIQFCSNESIHLISDEVYALSVFDRSGDGFVSAAEIMFEDLKNSNVDYKNVHIIYSLSKDFSLNGFRVGILWSKNENVIAALRTVSPFHGVSRHSQVLLARLLDDHEFIKYYLQENEKRLAKAYAQVTAILNHYQVNYVRAKAGVLLWIDLSKFIKKKLNKDTVTTQDELEFFELMMSEAKLYIPCGEFFQCQHEPGWFRICFTAKTVEFMQFSFERLFSWLDK